MGEVIMQRLKKARPDTAKAALEALRRQWQHARTSGHPDADRDSDRYMRRARMIQRVAGGE